jgi:hypothetical protein
MEKTGYSTSEFSQGAGDPEHPFRVLAAVSFKPFSHFAALRLRQVAEMNAQEFAAGLPAFLNLQIGVAAPRQQRQDRLDRS